MNSALFLLTVQVCVCVVGGGGGGVEGGRFTDLSLRNRDQWDKFCGEGLRDVGLQWGFPKV